MKIFVRVKIVLALSLAFFSFSAQSKLFYEQMCSFGLTNKGASAPEAALIQASDGFLYGTTSRGGYDGGGTVFRIQQDGSGFHVIHSFKDYPLLNNPPEAKYPVAGVIEGSDGKLYGTLSTGGTSYFGAVFSLDKDGKNPTTLHFFGAGTDGRLPNYGVIEGSDGALYGTTTNGGLHGAGVIFKLNKNGAGYSLLYQFMTNNSDGRFPCGGVIEGSDGALYGSTRHGGTNVGTGFGTVYRINKNGSGYTILHRFNPYPDGVYPMAPLLEAEDGFLYGTTQAAGAGYGCIFKMQKDGSQYEVIKNFGSGTGPGTTGNMPVTGLVQGADHLLYGITPAAGEFHYGTAFRVNTNGQDFAVLHNFGSNPEDGIVPKSRLLPLPEGRFFGTANGGGFGATGTIFQLAADSSYEVVHRFRLLGGDVSTSGGVIEGMDGRFYTTSGVGGEFGGGCLYSMNKFGADRRIVHSFQVGPPFPRNTYEDSLIFGGDNLLYGTTKWGGVSDEGVVYKVSPDGTGFTVLHEFVYATGVQPAPSLMQASDGAIYGATERGGSSGKGVIFKISGTNYSVIRNVNDGDQPNGRLIEATDGFLYGTTVRGGFGAGTLFRISKDGTSYLKLRDFNSPTTPGYFPSTLLEGSDGALYGTAEQSDSYSFGLIFRLPKDNSSFTVLHRFGSLSGDALTPWSGLIESPDGTLYGATSTGGTNLAGAIYSLNKDGTGYHIVHHLTTNNYDGVEPRGELLYASDGNIFGTTRIGGRMQTGTLFRLGLHLSLQVTQNIARIKMDAAPGKNYIIERSSALNSLWISLATNMAPSGTNNFIFDDVFPMSSNAFYRFRSAP